MARRVNFALLAYRIARTLSDENAPEVALLEGKAKIERKLPIAIHFCSHADTHTHVHVHERELEIKSPRCDLFAQRIKRSHAAYKSLI